MTDDAILSHGCALVPLPDRTHIEMVGSDRALLLHNLCTNDIKRLQPGQGCEAFLTDVRGKTIGHVLAFAGSASLALESVPGQSNTLMAHLDKYLITEDVQLVDQTDTRTEIALFGARSEQVLKEVKLDAPSNRYDHHDCMLQGHFLSLRRVAMTIEPCFLLQSTIAGIQAASELLEAAGAKSVAPELFEVARIEFGWPKFGKDFTADNFPQEVDRDSSAISFTKGCYLGQETVARIDALGHVNRQLVGLQLGTNQVPAERTTLTVDEKEVGMITSAVFSRRLSAPLAIGFVRAEHATLGTHVKCVDTTAKVVGLPVE